MAVSAGTEIVREAISSDILDDVLAEMVSRALITQAQANAMTVDAQEPLAEDVNQIYELFPGNSRSGPNTPVDEGDLLTERFQRQTRLRASSTTPFPAPGVARGCVPAAPEPARIPARAAARAAAKGPARESVRAAAPVRAAAADARGAADAAGAAPAAPIAVADARALARVLVRGAAAP